MKRTLADEFARWEAGEISAEQLRARHPDASFGSMMRLYEQLRTVEIPAASATDAGWESLRAQLPSAARKRHLLRRPLAVALGATLLSTSAAYAANVGAIRQEISSIVHDITGLSTGPALISPKEPKSTKVVPLQTQEEKKTEPVVPSHEVTPLRSPEINPEQNTHGDEEQTTEGVASPEPSASETTDGAAESAVEPSPEAVAESPSESPSPEPSATESPASDPGSPSD